MIGRRADSFFKKFVNGVERLYFSYDSKASELVGK